MGLFDNPNPAPTADVPEKKDETAEGQAVQGADNQQAPNPEQGGQTQEQQEAQKAAEELILGKFKSQDDLIKAYQSLQSSFGKNKNELGQLRKQIKELQSQFQQPRNVPQQQTPGEWTEEQWNQWGRQWYEKEFSQNPGRAVANLVAGITQQLVNPLHEQIQAQSTERAREQAIDSELSLLLEATDDEGTPLFPDAEQLADQIDDVLENNPFIKDVLAQQGLSRAKGEFNDLGVLQVIYDAVKSRAAQQIGQQAYKTGLQTGMKQALGKANASLPPPGAKNTQTAKTPEQQVVDEIFAHKKGGLFGF